jgi:hypothetical protein
MKTEKVKIGKIKTNPNNPRIIKDDKFKKLVQSIKDFPEMLNIRPIVVDKDNIVLGGNMRLRACQEAGLKEVPVLKADQLSEKQQREFIIKDNVGFGEWDWDDVANKWDADELEDWGFDVWLMPAETDYDLLNDEDFEDELNAMEGNVRRALQIPFEAEHYDEAKEVYQWWVDSGAYVGGMILQYLKQQKEKHEKN